jgi:23S rRNA (guanine2445-N2)-methyltransferase / 23S rRNA (guanine2069-N7)-methyltransferase
LIYVATVPRGLADLLAGELRGLGAAEARERGAGVSFEGELALGYRACLWSRVASRVLLQVADFDAQSTAEFHAAVRRIDWREHIPAGATIACEFTGKHPSIVNTQFGALTLKDGICDQLRETTGQRPDVQLHRPSVRLIAHANGPQVAVHVDLAGEGLHRRGYRQQAGEAPLRENVAAGLLMRVGWPAMLAEGREFLDPMCGSGTLVIEAAMMAANIAPGLARDYWGFSGWSGHDTELWSGLRSEALGRTRLAHAAAIRGTDADPRVLRNAEANAQRAGVEALVQFAPLRAADVRPLGTGPGLVATNPPYGERIGDAESALAAHAELGATLRAHFAGWEAAVLTAAPAGARALALRSYRTHALWNGALECRLLRFDLDHAGVREKSAGDRQAALAALAASPGAQMFANRLRKNLQRLGKQAARAGVSCWRVYDADMPEYSFAIDQYLDAVTAEQHLYVQEYAAPAEIEEQAVKRRRDEALAALPGASGVAQQHIHLRTRQRQRGASQYSPLASSGEFITVEEAGLRFQVNLNDYLDTGLFLDHRLTRQRIRDQARDARMLNLFCYTASASVYAAAGGAARTVSVDLSNTYLEWAARNFQLNSLPQDRHELVRADVREWLQQAAAGKARFELIFLDPPTFSNSKRMDSEFDVQRDHAALIDAAGALLAPGGTLLFSTNAQKFRLEPKLTEMWRVDDQTAASIPFDFERNPRIHRLFALQPG